MANSSRGKVSKRDRQVIAEYLRQMAADTHVLLHLADANMCGDVAAILRGRAHQVETPSGQPTSAPRPHAYAQI